MVVTLLDSGTNGCPDEAITRNDSVICAGLDEEGTKCLWADAELLGQVLRIVGIFL